MAKSAQQAAESTAEYKFRVKQYVTVSSNPICTWSKISFTNERWTRMQQAMGLPVRKTILAQKEEQLVSRHMYGVSWTVRASYPFTSWADA